jgi:hypothetical protein
MFDFGLTVVGRARAVPRAKNMSKTSAAPHSSKISKAARRVLQPSDAVLVGRRATGQDSSGWTNQTLWWTADAVPYIWCVPACSIRSSFGFWWIMVGVSGMASAFATGWAQYGPETHAQLANMVIAHHIPIGRAAVLAAQTLGIRPSSGFVATVRGKAAALLGPFVECVRNLLATAPALHVDETPARAAGGLAYVHGRAPGF